MYKQVFCGVAVRGRGTKLDSLFADVQC